MEEGNVGLAFGMVIGAGMCTSVGASAAFCVNLESKRFLAVSLALSAGVMFYVSMVEIFFKALSALSDEYCPERAVGDLCPKAYGATTGYFFLGIALTTGLNMITSQLGKCSGVKNTTGHGTELESGAQCCANLECTDPGTCAPIDQMNSGSPGLPKTQPLPPGWEVKLTHGTMKPFFYHTVSKEWSWTFPGLQGGGVCACDVHDGASGSPTTQGNLSNTMPLTSGPVPMLSTQAFGVNPPTQAFGVYPPTQAFGVYPPTQVFGVYPPTMTMGSAFGGSSLEIQRDHPEVDEKAKLNATGLLTGVAIAIHNFPEGLATFVAAMAEPALGASIAVAIAIHNVPEGVCVAMPIYYSTGSKLRAFMWATLSGVSEPVGALFGYAVLGGDISFSAYGAMFGIVAGVMVYISLAELLPNAYRYEKEKPFLVTAALISGMVIMALSLIAFQV